MPGSPIWLLPLFAVDPVAVGGTVLVGGTGFALLGLGIRTYTEAHKITALAQAMRADGLEAELARSQKRCDDDRERARARETEILDRGAAIEAALRARIRELEGHHEA